MKARGMVAVADLGSDGRGGLASFRVHGVAGGVVITAAGEIDSYTAPGLHDALQTATQTGSRVIIDLTDVTFIGSTGLGVILVARNAARQTGGVVSLVGASASVRRLLHLTRTDEAFSVYDRLEQAVAALTTHGSPT